MIRGFGRVNAVCEYSRVNRGKGKERIRIGYVGWERMSVLCLLFVLKGVELDACICGCP
jgi:hypothetical protein